MIRAGDRHSSGNEARKSDEAQPLDIVGHP
jgi:hypothetical protein